MASILDKYGIKEVADVTFYAIENDGSRGLPVLYLDTLKVSTIEQTAENVEARGGKGNPALVSWDYGKEINVTLEDALFSAKSMAIMFAGSEKVGTTTATVMHRTVEWTATTTETSFTKARINKKSYTATNVKYIDPATGSTVTTPTTSVKYLVEFDVAMDAASAGVIEITNDSFPGTYYITGDTYARSSINGQDEFFQFVIPKAKVQAENTITLQAEGDPSTFNLSLRVMRPDDGVMMKLIKYNLTGGTDNSFMADGKEANTIKEMFNK